MNKENILDALIIISVLLAVVFFLWYLFGNSPTIEQLIFAAVAPTYVFAFRVYEKLNDKFNQLNERLARIEGKLDIKEH